jgi:phenylpropionate dioxygenase-like ring-hydroxylating dioxygenase large terminal subunit
MPLSPADFFTPQAFERECAGVLAQGWIPVCRSEEVAEPGAQKAVVVVATPVLVVRDRGGALHALSNVCRHRAMTLVEGETQAEVIRCPYHLWTYGLDGVLQAAPFMDAGAVAGCDLPRYAASEWGGWVFVNLSRNAPPLVELLAPLNADLQPARLAACRAGFRIALTHDWNWKVMVENFGESYHHIGTHAQTLQPLWPGGQTDSTPSTAHWIDIRHPVHESAGELRVIVVFPLFMIATTPPHEGAVWYRMNPTGPERIELEIVGLYPPEQASDPAAMAQAKAQLWAIHQEDMVVCERTQAGLRSPDAALGPLSILEAGVARFREWAAAGSAG